MKRITTTLILLMASLLVLIWLTGVYVPGLAQQATPEPPVEEAPTPLPGSPVEVGGKVIFYISERIGSILPDERARLIGERITGLAANPFAPPATISLVESSEGIDIVNEDQIIMTVTLADARAAGKAIDELADELAVTIQNAIDTTRLAYTPQSLLVRFGESLLLLTILIVVLIVINRLYNALVQRLDKIQELERNNQVKPDLLHSETTIRIFKMIVKFIRWILILFLLIFIIPLVLRIFPATARFARQITQLILAPFAAFWSWLVVNQENFTTIAIIFVITYLLIRLERFIFKEIERGALRFKGFEAEWAPFTSNIVAVLLIVGAVVVAFPYIPGSDSDAFRGITIFLGALFTLSSTSAVTNIVAGVIQTYTGAFRVGDVVKIGMNTGIVTEKRLLTTRIRTFKNEDVSIPNGSVLNTDVTNYSTIALATGLVLYTTITIGYDAPWKTVHELLVSAALATPDILPDPKPFVLQTSLNDYHVSYQINCYTNHPENMARIYSDLHANIQDQFNQAGVEIMSPGFMGLRDANKTTIPVEYLPQDYQAPGFRT